MARHDQPGRTERTKGRHSPGQAGRKALVAAARRAGVKGALADDARKGSRSGSHGGGGRNRRRGGRTSAESTGAASVGARTRTRTGRTTGRRTAQRGGGHSARDLGNLD